MIDLSIDRITLELQGAAGHEHRVQPIVARAMTLLGEELAAIGDTRPDVQSATIEALSTSSLRLDLARMGDEEAAHRLAYNALAAFVPYLGGSSWPR